jgi:hypothetical protein
VDPYWSTLLAGDYRDPKKPSEGNTLRQYQDWQNESKAVARSIEQTRKYQAELKEEAEKAEEAAGGEIVVRVGGSVHLDVTFEMTHEIAEEEMEEGVSYRVEKQVFKGQPLRSLRTQIGKDVRAFLDTIGAQIEERKEALDRMFEGAARRPTGPEIPDREFSLPFSWTGGDEAEKKNDASFTVQATAVLKAREPNTLRVTTTATLRKVARAVQIAVQREGPKVSFALSPLTGPAFEWESDKGFGDALDGTGIQGKSARAFLFDRSGAGPAVAPADGGGV